MASSELFNISDESFVSCFQQGATGDFLDFVKIEELLNDEYGMSENCADGQYSNSESPSSYDASLFFLNRMDDGLFRSEEALSQDVFDGVSSNTSTSSFSAHRELLHIDRLESPISLLCTSTDDDIRITREQATSHFKGSDDPRPDRNVSTKKECRKQSARKSRSAAQKRRGGRVSRGKSTAQETEAPLSSFSGVLFPFTVVRCGYDQMTLSSLNRKIAELESRGL